MPSLGNNRQKYPQVPYVMRGCFKESLSLTCAADYSYLRATIGSTRTARRAGMEQAASRDIWFATGTRRIFLIGAPVTVDLKHNLAWILPEMIAAPLAPIATD